MAEEIRINVELEIGANLADILNNLIDKVSEGESPETYTELFAEIKDLIVASIHEVMLTKQITP